MSDARWFELLFDRHYGRIHRFCAARAGTDAAEDLASETFVTAFRRRGDYDPSYADAAPWLFGIALNLSRAFHRGELGRRRLSDRALLGLVSAVESPQPYGGNEVLSAALQGLSERDRDLIVLFAWAELTYEQLGECFGMPVGTVRSRLSRIRQRLRLQLVSAAAEESV